MIEGQFKQLDKPHFIKTFLDVRSYQQLDDNGDESKPFYQLQVNAKFNPMQNPQLALTGLSKDALDDVVEGLYLIYCGLFYDTGVTQSRLNNLMNVFDGLFKTYQNQMTFTLGFSVDDVPANVIDRAPQMEIPSSLENYDPGLSSHGRSVHDSLADNEIPLLNDTSESRDDSQVDKTPHALTDSEKQTLSNYHEDLAIKPSKLVDNTNQKSAFDLLDNTPIEDSKLAQKSAALSRLNSMRANRTQISQAPIMSLADLMHQKSADDAKPKYVGNAKHHRSADDDTVVVSHDKYYDFMVQLVPNVKQSPKHMQRDLREALKLVVEKYADKTDFKDVVIANLKAGQFVAPLELSQVLASYSDALQNLPLDKTWLKFLKDVTPDAVTVIVDFYMRLTHTYPTQNYDVVVDHDHLSVQFDGHVIGQMNFDGNHVKFTFENFDDDLLNHDHMKYFQRVAKKDQPVYYQTGINAQVANQDGTVSQDQYRDKIDFMIACYNDIANVYRYYNNGKAD